MTSKFSTAVDPSSVRSNRLYSIKKQLFSTGAVFRIAATAHKSRHSVLPQSKHVKRKRNPQIGV